MDEEAKKTALRMIPYGLYLLAARAEDGDTTAATVNWVTQASFEPPLVAVGVKADSHCLDVVRSAGVFALSVLGAGQNDLAFAFFKSPEFDDAQIGGVAYEVGRIGAPLLAGPIAHLECKVAEIRDVGDHSVVIGEVLDARVVKEPEGRADDATLKMGELGEKTFYGG